MNRVYLQIINPIIGSETSATITDPTDPNCREANALKYFGIDSVDWDSYMLTDVPNEKYKMITRIGHVPNTSKIVIISYYDIHTCK